MRGYCDTGRLKIAIAPAMDSTIAMTIAKRGRSTKMRENVLISSIDFLSDSFICCSLRIISYQRSGSTAAVARIAPSEWRRMAWNVFSPSAQNADTSASPAFAACRKTISISPGRVTRPA